MIFGIIDIGSNTIRMNIYKVEQEQFEELISTKDSAGLVSYIENGSLNQEGIDKLASVLTNFKTMLDLLHVDQYAAFATASLRNIKNSKEVIQAIKEKVGMSIDLLSGSMEGSLSFDGALQAIQAEEGMYIDTGGGSTEVILYNKGKINFVASMPIGSLNLFNMYVKGLLPTEKEVKEIKKAVLKEINAIEPKGKKLKARSLAVTGGSFRAVRSLLIAKKWIKADEYTIKPVLLKKLIKELINDEASSIRQILKVKADRLHTLTTGLIIVYTLAEYIQAEIIEVSFHGIREGYLMNKLKQLESD